MNNLQRHRAYGVQETTMRQLMCVVLVAVLVAVAANADSLTIRQDLKDGRKPSYAVGVVTPKFEAWTFAQPGFPLWEFGRLDYWSFGARSGVLAGGYISYWQKTGQTYVEPWSLWRQTAGDTTLTAKLAAYVPLNGGGWWLYSDQTAVTWPVTKRVSLGVAADWWLVEGAKPAAGFGAVANLNVGKLAISLRALHGFNEADSLRMEVAHPF